MSAALAKKPVDKLTSSEAEKELDRLARKSPSTTGAIMPKTRPVISDADYDALRRRNDAIEARFPAACAARQPIASRRRQGLGEIRQGRARQADAVAGQRLHATRTWHDFAARVRRFLGLKEDDELTPSPPSPRSTGCPPRCAMRTASSCRAPRAATARKAKTSPPICSTINDIPLRLHGKAAGSAGSARRSLYDPRGFRGAQQAAGEGWQARLRQSAQLGRRFGAPARSLHHRRRERSISSPMPGARSAELPAGHAMGHAASVRRLRLHGQSAGPALRDRSMQF